VAGDELGHRLGELPNEGAVRGADGVGGRLILLEQGDDDPDVASLETILEAVGEGPLDGRHGGVLPVLDAFLDDRAGRLHVSRSARANDSGRPEGRVV
jgi:hypothetical protein